MLEDKPLPFEELVLVLRDEDSGSECSLVEAHAGEFSHPRLFSNPTPYWGDSLRIDTSAFWSLLNEAVEMAPWLLYSFEDCLPNLLESMY